MISRKNKFLAVFLSALLFVGTAFMGVSVATKKVTIKSVKASENGDSAKITIKKFKGAKGYQIRYGYKKNFKGAKVKNIKKTSVTLKKLKAGKTLYIKARAKLKKGYSKFSKVKKIVLSKNNKVTTTKNLNSTEGTTTTIPTTAVNPTSTKVAPTHICPDGNPTDAFIASCEGFTLKYLNPWEAPEVGSPLYETNVFTRQMVESEFKCTIEENSLTEGYTTALVASLAAGTPQAHIYRVPSEFFVDFYDNGYFADLTQGMKGSAVDFKDDWYDESCSGLFNINTKQYAWYEFSQSPYKIYYNKRLIEEADLVDPLSVVGEGEWTWDLYANSYSPKISPMVIQDNSAELLLKAMVGSYGKSVSKVAKGKIPTTNIDDPVFETCLTALYQWCTEGYADVSEKDWSEVAKSFGEGETAMYYGDNSILSYIDKDKFNSEIGVVPFPKPTKTQTKYYNLASPTYSSFIPKEYTKDVGKILFINNELNRQKYRFLKRDFTILNMVDFKGAELDVLTDIEFCQNNHLYSRDWSVFFEANSTTLNLIASSVIEGEHTPQSAIETYIDELKQTYKDGWGDKVITGEVS